MNTRRVVVTGIGGITAFGRDWQSIQAAFKAEKNAVKYMDWRERFPELEAQLGAPIEGYTPPEHWTRKQLRSMGRVSHLCVDAAEQALTDAGLLGDESITDGRMGVACGSSVGSTKDIGDMGELLNTGTSRNFNANTYVRMMPHTTAANIGIFFGLKGRIIPTSSACSSGSQGIGYAYEAIKYGKIPMMLAGGADQLCPSEAFVFDSLYAASRRNGEPELTPCPYDAARDGLVLGEGGCMMVLEELEHAKARGAKIYGEVLGYGMTCDAYHITSPSPDGSYAAKAMEEAIREAGLRPEDIAYFNAHGTSTPLNDKYETLAIRRVFGEKFGELSVSSTKSQSGHLLGASGALESIATLLALEEGILPPIVNFEKRDPECDLNLVTEIGQERSLQYAMKNSLGFGGHNTALVFGKWEGV